MTGKAEQAPRLIPTGECWCGCGRQATLGSFFAQGHDKVAESAIIKLEYGGVPQFLVAHGFGPGGRNAKWELRELLENPPSVRRS